MTEFDLYWGGLGLMIPTMPREVARNAFEAGVRLSADVVASYRDDPVTPANSAALLEHIEKDVRRRADRSTDNKSK